MDVVNEKLTYVYWGILPSLLSDENFFEFFVSVEIFPFLVSVVTFLKMLKEAWITQEFSQIESGQGCKCPFRQIPNEARPAGKFRVSTIKFKRSGTPI